MQASKINPSCANCRQCAYFLYFRFIVHYNFKEYQFHLKVQSLVIVRHLWAFLIRNVLILVVCSVAHVLDFRSVAWNQIQILFLEVFEFVVIQWISMVILNRFFHIFNLNSFMFRTSFRISNQLRWNISVRDNLSVCPLNYANINIS